MAASDPLSSAGPFTPSEIVLLHGGSFARDKGFNDSEELLLEDRKVRASDLSQAALAAALLAAERQGALRLVVGSKKTLFGLRTVEVLKAESLSASVAWPSPSLENTLAQTAASLKGSKGGDEVENLVYALIGSDSQSPENAILTRVKEHLAARELIDTGVETTMKIFKTRYYRVTDAQAAEIRRHPPDFVKRLLEETPRARPREWELLAKAVKSALLRRTESDVGDTD